MGCKSSKIDTASPLGSGAHQNTNKRSRSGPAKIFDKLDTFRVAKGQKVSDNLVRPFVASPEEGDKYEVVKSRADKMGDKECRSRGQRPKAAKGPRTRHTDPVVEVCNTEKNKTKVTCFEVSQEREACLTPVQVLPKLSRPSRKLLKVPDITRNVSKKRSPDMSLESEGLLPGSVMEMESTRRKRVEAEALRAWMERMQALDRAKM